MKCPKCDYAKKLKHTWSEFDYSKDSGIPGCVLSDVKKYTCPRCGEVYFDLGDMDDINQQIAMILCAAEKLTRKHIKWIRTHYLQLDYWGFAKIVRKSPEYLKQLENNKKPVTEEIQSIIQSRLAKKILSQRIKIVIED